MDSRERVHLTLNHEIPDRVPVDCWMSEGTKAKVSAVWGCTYEEFLDSRDVDMRYINVPEYKGPSRLSRENSDVDLFGVQREKVNVRLNDGVGDYEESYREVISHPLANAASVEEVLDYPGWPSADWFDYSHIEEQCDALLSRGRVVVFVGDRLNRLAQLKPAMYLRGMESILIDLIEHQEIAEAIFRRLIEFYLEYGRRIMESAKGKIDILCSGDDFGSQNGLLISPDCWSNSIEKGFRAFIDLGHAYGVKVMHHTCGSVPLLIPRMIDCGLDILQSLQPEAEGMDAATLKAEFGDKLVFHGGISIQSILPRGSADEVRAHVSRQFQALSPGGGYIAGTAHNIQADTPLTNIEALFQAYRDFWDYS